MTRAVVFAYHDVGAQCLRGLLAQGIDVPLVVTHCDDPREALWFERVADVATTLGIPWIAPEDPNVPEVVARVAALAPDFLFSFYYRRMLAPALLALAPRGALNLHGSLLPKYRGRAPVNWAILKGERETGVTLHYMTEKPDAGAIVAQQAVPILEDDTARDVFDKVTVAAAATLGRVLPALVAGTAPRLPNPLAQGSYFGGRRPEDGRIDWSRSATEVHDLVRAVAPPFPGAFTTLAGHPVRILRSRVVDRTTPATKPVLHAGEGLLAQCGGGGSLAILALEVDGALAAPADVRARFGETVALPGARD